MLQIKGFRAALLGIFLLSLLGVQLNAKAEKQTVYVIPVEKMSNRVSPRFCPVRYKTQRMHMQTILFLISIPRGIGQICY